MNQNIKVKNYNSKSNNCLVAFSSNSINKDNKFEFENICHQRKIRKTFKKIIFLRDPENRFYINGIGDELNGINKLTMYLYEQTKNMNVFCIGYSSGAYMALISSFQIKNVKRSICCGPIINIYSFKGAKHNYNFCELDCVKNATGEQKRYLDITKDINNANAEIYGFFAGNSECDKQVISQIKANNITKLRYVIFNTSKHGDYCYPFDYKYLLTKSDKKLQKIFNKYKDKKISPLRFSLALQGPFLFAYNYTYKLLRCLLRRLKH